MALTSYYVIKHSRRQTFYAGLSTATNVAGVQVPTETTDILKAKLYASVALAQAGINAFPSSAVLQFPCEIIGVSLPV